MLSSLFAGEKAAELQIHEVCSCHTNNAVYEKRGHQCPQLISRVFEMTPEV